MANYTMTIGEMMNNPLTNQIFPENYPFYIDNDEARKAFEEKFIARYYYNEIGFESPFMFKQKLESLLVLKAPYWEQLYQTELESKNINFMLNKDLQETFIRELDQSKESNGKNSVSQSNTSSTTSNITSNQSGTSNNNHQESSIRDGVSSSSLTEGYLTGVSKDEGESTVNSQTTGEDHANGTLKSDGLLSQSENESQIEKTELISKGNIGITSSAQLLKEWRDVLINMDEIIINECKDLFMKIY